VVIPIYSDDVIVQEKKPYLLSIYNMVEILSKHQVAKLLAGGGI